MVINVRRKYGMREELCTFFVKNRDNIHFLEKEKFSLAFKLVEKKALKERQEKSLELGK